MKNTKRFASILLALAMIFVMALPAFATEELNLKGSITITDTDTVKASQKNFSAYKILNLKVYGDPETNEITSYSYSVPREETELVAFYEAYFNLDSTQTDFDAKVADAIIKMGEAGTLYDFQKEVLKACANLAPYNGKVVTDGFQFANLPLGYYIIEDTTNPKEDARKPVTALMLQTATPNVEVEVKAEKPPVDKKIDDDNNLDTTDDRVDANEAAIGDTITYVIESKVPDMTGYTKYYFIMRDTLSKGLTYSNNMKVTVGDKELVEGVDYTLTKVDNEDATTSLKIVFNNFIQYNTDDYYGDPIVVSYTAVLNQECEINKYPNINKVDLEYSDDPDVECEGENEPTPDDLEKDPTGITPEQKVETYTTSLEIVKTDPSGVRLQGAVFTVTGHTMNTVRVEFESFDLDPNGNYWKLKDGSYTTTDPESQLDNATINKELYASLTDKYTKTTTTEYKTQQGEELTITGTVGQDGVLRFEGIPSGEYVITEVKAPNGYNILTKTLTVNIKAELKETAGEGYIEYTYEGAADENGVARVAVINQQGTILPSTGGRGTTMFYIIGGILVLAAVVLLVARKRMSAHE